MSDLRRAENRLLQAESDRRTRPMSRAGSQAGHPLDDRPAAFDDEPVAYLWGPKCFFRSFSVPVMSMTQQAINTPMESTIPSQSGIEPKA